MSPGKDALAFHTSQGKFKQMLEDDSFFDVTVEDVEKLVGLMERGGCSRDEIVRIPKKCFVFLRDKEKEFMVRLGLNYDDHSITKKGPVFLLNGYTESQWRMLVDEDYYPAYQAISRAINTMMRLNDQEAVQTLRVKYGLYRGDRDRRILEAHGIPLDTKYEKLTTTTIDGISFNTWHLLYNDDYSPSKSVLISILFHLRKKERYTEANAIETKYRAILHPNQTFTDDEIDEANNYFSHFLD